MDDAVIISPDTERPHRLPAGHTQTFDWPDRPHPVPPFDPATWDFTVFPASLAGRMARFTWGQFRALPRVRVFADIHADGASRLNNLWEGVPARELLNHVRPAADARFVAAHGEYGYSACFAWDEFFAADTLFALRHDGRDLAPEHGFPVRLVVPRRPLADNIRWVRGVEFLSAARSGFSR